MIRTFRILALFCAFLPLLAAHAAPQVDVEYKLIKPAQPVTGKNVEVIEFFAYACPHCAEFEPALQSWLKRKPKDVDYRPVPMIFRAEWKPGAKVKIEIWDKGRCGDGSKADPHGSGNGPPPRWIELVGSHPANLEARRDGAAVEIKRMSPVPTTLRVRLGSKQHN